MTRKINVYRLLILILIAGMGAQSYKINTLQYYSVDNAVECIGKAGKMTQEGRLLQILVT